MRNYSEKESSVIRNVLSGQVVSEIARVSAEMKSYLPIPDFLDALVNDTIKAYIGANYRQIKLGIIVLAACRPGLFEKYHNANFFHHGASVGSCGNSGRISLSSKTK